MLKNEGGQGIAALLLMLFVAIVILLLVPYLMARAGMPISLDLMWIFH